MDDVFFLLHQDQTWTGIGYFVRTNAAVANSFGTVGTLYRFETNAPDLVFESNPDGLYMGYLRARAGFNPGRRAPGLGRGCGFPGSAGGHGRVVGPLQPRPGTRTECLPLASSLTANRNIGYDASAYKITFWGNAVPAFVELELGVLEQQTLQHLVRNPRRVRSTELLSQQAGSLHLFRQRIAVRKVDPSAYP